MYDDPRHVRKNVHRIRFNEISNDRLIEKARESQRQPATLIHDLSLLGLKVLEEKYAGDVKALARVL